MLDDEILVDPEVAKVIEENDGKVKMSMDIRSLFFVQNSSRIWGGGSDMMCFFLEEEFTY